MCTKALICLSHRHLHPPTLLPCSSPPCRLCPSLWVSLSLDGRRGCLIFFAATNCGGVGASLMPQCVPGTRSMCSTFTHVFVVTAAPVGRYPRPYLLCNAQQYDARHVPCKSVRGPSKLQEVPQGAVLLSQHGRDKHPKAGVDTADLGPGVLGSICVACASMMVLMVASMVPRAT